MLTFLRNGIIAAMLAGAIVACGGGGGGSGAPAAPTAPSSLPTVQNVVPAAGSIYLGAFSNPTQVTPPPIAALTAFEAQIGRTVAITPHYYGFYDTFPGPYEADDSVHNRMPIDSWDCEVPDAAIAAGNQDALIRKRADALKEYGKPVMLRYMWEMNLPANQFFRQLCYDPATDSPNGIFSATEFIAAWDRMRQIFLQEGATNVIWLWNPSGSNDPLRYYPGPSEVDWIGFDKYDDTSTPFAETYAQSYDWLAPLGKPIVVGETGAAAAIQSTFFESAVATLKSQYPLVKGYVYFNSAGPTNSWVIAPSALGAFKLMAADPYFSAKVP
jgi:hypothetical protein